MYFFRKLKKTFYILHQHRSINTTDIPEDAICSHANLLKALKSDNLEEFQEALSAITEIDLSSKFGSLLSFLPFVPVRVAYYLEALVTEVTFLLAVVTKLLVS